MLSMELRKIIIADLEDGMEVKEISKALRVSQSAIYELKRRKEKTGSIEPDYQGNCGRPPKISGQQIADMEALVEQQSDITLEEIRQKLDLPIQKSQISALLQKLGFRKKKDDPRFGTEKDGCQASAGRLEGEAKCLGQCKTCVFG